MTLDSSAPEVGSAIITTSEYPDGGDGTPKLCQRSSTTMVVEFDGFFDPETGIEKYSNFL